MIYIIKKRLMEEKTTVIGIVEWIAVPSFGGSASKKVENDRFDK